MSILVHRMKKADTLLHCLERLLEIDIAGIESFTDNRSFGAKLLEHKQVLYGSDSTGGNYRQPGL